MSRNQYDDFKNGIKRDIQGAALGIFAGIGLLLLVFVMLSTVMWFFLKKNHYGIFPKSIAAISVLSLGIAMLSSRKVGNFVLLLWLKFLLCVVILLIAAIFGSIVYWILLPLKDDF